MFYIIPVSNKKLQRSLQKIASQSQLIGIFHDIIREYMAKGLPLIEFLVFGRERETDYANR